MITYKLTQVDDLEMTKIFLYGDEVSAKTLPFKKDEVAYIAQRRAHDANAIVELDRFTAQKEHYTIYVVCFNPEQGSGLAHETFRKTSSQLQQTLMTQQVQRVAIYGVGLLPEDMIAFVEGLTLSNYRFDKYKSKKETLLDEVLIAEGIVTQSALDNNIHLWSHILDCRDWVNEPVMYFNAQHFADVVREKALSLGVEVTVLEQHQIESLKMGGLLAVNRGSVDEARFVVLEYKPADRVNAHPIALVGKGITYDTGGLNLKPDDYMREMKSDMAGAATMANVLFAAAENKLPVYLMAFLPMTDNRPCGNAYAADDIITMYDGTTVEVVNTDAEGRIILADAIAYANQFEPELIIDAATLTGAAVRAIGTYGIVAMQQRAEDKMNLLKIVGEQVYERIAEMPFWSEYDKLIESDVADIKNCGPAEAGAITAGKFLAHFAKAPFIHLDIAGVAYFNKKESFHGIGGSGYAIRLLYAFFQTYDLTKRNQ